MVDNPTFRDLLAESGLSQRTLATKAGMSPSYITDLKLGKKTNPTLELVDRLARALGVSREAVQDAILHSRVDTPDSGADEAAVPAADEAAA